MTKWFHKCDLEWMKARQKCLTATDVKDLLPFTKTGRKRAVTDEMYWKVWARKQVNLTEEDCISVGAAARGHILEPYAIDRYNEEDFGGNECMWHWDDVVITGDLRPFTLAFSPDAMDYPMSGGLNQRLLAGSCATAIAEVKSYSAEKHLICGHTPKADLEERWQIATAMAVCPDIQTAYLLFYNPSLEQQLFIVDYDRADLANEIAAVKQVEEDWLTWIAGLSKLDAHYTVTGKPDEEQAIIRNIIKREELNPEGTKSVTR